MSATKNMIWGRIGWLKRSHASGGKLSTSKYQQENKFPQTLIKTKKLLHQKPKLSLILYKLHFQYETTNAWSGRPKYNRQILVNYHDFYGITNQIKRLLIDFSRSPLAPRRNLINCLSNK